MPPPVYFLIIFVNRFGSCFIFFLTTYQKRYIVVLDNLHNRRRFKKNMKEKKKKLTIKFFENESGREPVREWLKNEKEISFDWPMWS